MFTFQLHECYTAACSTFSTYVPFNHDHLQLHDVQFYSAASDGVQPYVAGALHSDRVWSMRNTFYIPYMCTWLDVSLSALA